MRRWRITRVAEMAILLESDQWDPELAPSLVSALNEIPTVLSAVTGFESITLIVDGRVPDDALRRALGSPSVSGGPSLETIRVAVDEANAPDLARFLDRQELARNRFEQILEDLDLRVRHLGFRPGFAYLDGLPAIFDVPRHETPRTRVPAGSLGVARRLAGFYPDASPGGWWLLGRTDALLWDESRDPPNLLAPGDRVAISLCDPAELVDRSRSVIPPAGERFARVEGTGTFAAIVAGRPNWSFPGRGKSAGGPWDVERAGLANYAVGNDQHAGVIEVLGSGPTLSIEKQAIFSWQGDPQALVLDGRRVEVPIQFEAADGSTLAIGALREESYGVLAVRGGFDLAARSRLETGHELCRGEATVISPRIRSSRRDVSRVLHVAEGPSRVDRELLERVTSVDWEIQRDSDRSGTRLRTESPPREIPEIRSIGAQPGSVQLTPAGELIVLGPEHPVTGGYLQPFTLLRTEIWKAGTLRSGERVRFEVVRPANCSELEI